MQTIAQQLNIKDFPFIIKDRNGREIYHESSYGSWYRSEYDSKGNEIYCEASNGYWTKKEYNCYDYRTYFEDSTGYIEDDRPQTEVQKAIELLEKEGMLVEGKIIKN